MGVGRRTSRSWLKSEEAAAVHYNGFALSLGHPRRLAKLEVMRTYMTALRYGIFFTQSSHSPSIDSLYFDG